MARPLRVEFEDAVYYLCLRANGGQRIIYDDRDRLRFLELVSEFLRGDYARSPDGPGGASVLLPAAHARIRSRAKGLLIG